jgi:hypothetical protein
MQPASKIGYERLSTSESDRLLESKETYTNGKQKKRLESQIFQASFYFPTRALNR